MRNVNSKQIPVDKHNNVQSTLKELGTSDSTDIKKHVYTWTDRQVKKCMHTYLVHVHTYHVHTCPSPWLCHMCVLMSPAQHDVCKQVCQESRLASSSVQFVAASRGL